MAVAPSNSRKMMEGEMNDQVYKQVVHQYRCRSCSQVVWVDYVENELSEDKRTEMLERSIKAHNWIEHGKK